MRFITEFKVPETFHGDPAYFPKHTERFMRNNEENLRYEMGKMLQESFSWQTPVNGNPQHYRLEIEAFPMDKWVEFKNLLLGELYSTEVCRQDIIDKLQELESFGKPAGEAKEQL